MVATVNFNPYATTNAPGTFTVQTDGDVQGTYFDDPAVRFQLRTGLIASTETIPMWGGIGVSELVPTVGAANPDQSLGTLLGRATTVANGYSTGALSGFTVFNQAHNMIVVPGNSVPLVGSGNTISYFRLGSRARIAVACDPSLVSLEGGLVGAQVSWDFSTQRLQPYDASTATIAASATVTWANTSGGQLTFPVAAWTGAFQPVAGDVLEISGATNTGTGGAAAINSIFTVVSATSTQAVLAAPAAAGYFGTIGGSPVLNFGSGALPCRIDRVSTGNSMVVTYNTVTGAASWNYAGATAVIEI